jgi:prevent-host-death family protein
MTKSYSIAEARANLPAIVDQAEVGNPIELTRRGKPVAVVVSRELYDKLTSSRPRFADALRAFRDRFDVEDFGLEPDFVASLRSSDSGRRVEL